MNFKDAYKSYNDEISGNREILASILSGEVKLKMQFNYRPLLACAALVLLLASAAFLRFSGDDAAAPGKDSVVLVASNDEAHDSKDTITESSGSDTSEALISQDESHASAPAEKSSGVNSEISQSANTANASEDAKSYNKDTSVSEQSTAESGIRIISDDTRVVAVQPPVSGESQSLNSASSPAADGAGRENDEVVWVIDEDVRAEGESARANDEDARRDSAPEPGNNISAESYNRRGPASDLPSDSAEDNSGIAVASIIPSEDEVPEAAAADADDGKTAGNAAPSAAYSSGAGSSGGGGGSKGGSATLSKNEWVNVSTDEYFKYIGIDILSVAQLPEDMNFEGGSVAKIQKNGQMVVNDEMYLNAVSDAVPQRCLTVYVSKMNAFAVNSDINVTGNDSFNSALVNINGISINIDSQNVTKAEVENLIKSLK